MSAAYWLWRVFLVIGSAGLGPQKQALVKNCFKAFNSAQNMTIKSLKLSLRRGLSLFSVLVFTPSLFKVPSLPSLYCTSNRISTNFLTIQSVLARIQKPYAHGQMIIINVEPNCLLQLCFRIL